MAGRRANHEGSIYRRRSGLWCAQISLNGHRLTKYGRTQQECRNWIKEQNAKIDMGMTYENTTVTLEEYLRVWLDGKDISRRSNTVTQYRIITEHHIIPNIGKNKLQEIRSIHLHQLYTELKEKGLGARTRQVVHAILHNAFKNAIREGILSRNPAEAVERPKVEQKEIHVLTEEQARQLLLTAAGDRNEALYYLALMTGMREGEILGLKWSDVDWNRGVINVQRQLQRVSHNGLNFVPLKTRSGKRQIKLGQGMLDRLSAHREKQNIERNAKGDRWHDYDLIFPSSLGTPLDCRRILRVFKDLLTKAGLPNIRFHDLRHTSLSLLMDLGISVTTIQQRADHSKASVTTDIYGHSMARSQDLAAMQIEELITPIAVDLQ
jgi:integrase